MNGDYDEGEVDAFLERVEQELRNPVGGLTAADIENAAFSRVERGYVPGEVDALLERLAQQFRNPQAGGLTADHIHNVAFTSHGRRRWYQTRRSSSGETPFFDAIIDFFFR
jgi:DivIVA domain-containing protein